MKAAASQTNKRKNERGAILVEATIALTAFMFAMFTLLSVIQIAYVQARFSVAIQSAAKEIAEYSHLYYAVGLDGSLDKSTGKSSEIANYLGDLFEDLGANKAAEAFKGDSVLNELKKGISSALVKKLMEKNLTDTLGGSSEDFLRRYHVTITGYVVPDFMNNKEGKASKNVAVAVEYDVQVIKLLNVDYKYHMRSFAYSETWSGK